MVLWCEAHAVKDAIQSKRHKKRRKASAIEEKNEQIAFKPHAIGM